MKKNRISNHRMYSNKDPFLEHYNNLIELQIDMVKFLSKEVGILLRKRERTTNADSYLIICETIQTYQNHIQHAGKIVEEYRKKIKNYVKIEVNGIGENSGK